jgi:hypothetical protein
MSPQDPERPQEPVLIDDDPTATPRPAAPAIARLAARLRRVRRAMAARLLRAVLREASSQARPDDGGPSYRCRALTPPDRPASRAGRSPLAGAVGSAAPDPHDGVAAMLSILTALRDGGRASLGELCAATGLGPERLAGHALNLEEDGCVFFEREQTLRLTSSGRTALEALGRVAASRAGESLERDT